MENHSVDDQATELVQASETKPSESQDIQEPEAQTEALEPTSETEVSEERPATVPEKGFLKIPQGAIADIKRKQRELGRNEGRQEALAQIQREYQALMEQKGNPEGSPSPTPASSSPYYDSKAYFENEAKLVEGRGNEKYPGTHFDPKSQAMVGSFEQVVLNQVQRDPRAGKVAAEIIKGEYPLHKSDVMYKVFSDPEFLDDLRYMEPAGIQHKIHKYLYSQRSGKPVARPANPPLSEIKTSTTKQVDKEPTFQERLALYKKSKR